MVLSWRRVSMESSEFTSPGILAVWIIGYKAIKWCIGCKLFFVLVSHVPFDLVALLLCTYYVTSLLCLTWNVRQFHWVWWNVCEEYQLVCLAGSQRGCWGASLLNFLLFVSGRIYTIYIPYISGIYSMYAYNCVDNKRAVWQQLWFSDVKRLFAYV